MEIAKSLLAIYPHNAQPNPTLEGVLGSRNDGNESESCERKSVLLRHSDPCLPASLLINNVLVLDVYN